MPPEILCPECLEEGHGRYRPPDPKATRNRCTTHWRAVERARRLASKEKRVARVYSLSAAEYDAIYEAQGGLCFICRRATGATKRLAVDHDHACCPGAASCGLCVRALLCGPCNQQIGFWRSVEALQRAAMVLQQRPAQAILRKFRQKGNPEGS